MKIDIQNGYVNDLFTQPAAPHQLVNLVAYVEELLNLGASARIVENGAVLKEFKLPGQFSDHVNLVMALRFECSHINPRNHPATYNRI